MFNPSLTAADWYLDSLDPGDLPTFACEALERGHDGKNLQQLAALVKPTRREVNGIVDSALRELGVAVPLNKDEAVEWTLSEVKSSAGSADLTAENLVGKLLTALPELEQPYLKMLRSGCGRPGNYGVFSDCLRPAVRGHIREGASADFIRRAASFMEQVCGGQDREAINVLWIVIFVWLVHSPAGELKPLWPALGPFTRAVITEVAQRRGETANLP